MTEDILKRDKPMHSPPHPGEILEALYLHPLGIDNTEFAKRIGADRKTVSRLINGQTGISTGMAVRLAIVLQTSPHLWMNMQSAYDLHQFSMSPPEDIAKLKKLKRISYYREQLNNHLQKKQKATRKTQEGNASAEA